MSTRSRRLAATALALAVVLLGAVALHVGDRWTQAGFLGTETVTTIADADEVPLPTSTCTVVSGAPHILTLTDAGDGLPVLEYRVEISVSHVPSGSYSWATGTVDDTPMLPVGESFWSADTAQVGWGIKGWSLGGGSWSGTVKVQAIGPGGWTSDPVYFDWSIVSPGIGAATVTCAPH